MSRTLAGAPILVAGAGPAGATLARLLCLRGKEVVLIDGGPSSHKRLELIAPNTAGLFLAAGLADILHDPAISRPCHGTRRLWDGIVSVDDFLATPPGWGRTVDRARMDAVMFGLAARAGATVMKGRVRSASARADGVAVDLTDGRRVEGAFVVDATGRASAVARRLGARRLFSKRRVATREQWERTDDDRLVVEGSPAAWRYALNGPDGQADCWRISNPVRHRRMQGVVVDASSSRLDIFAGEYWLAIGDASVGFDPISSQGLGHAIAGAMTAAGKLLGSCRMSNEDRDAFAVLNLQTWAAHPGNKVELDVSCRSIVAASSACAAAEH